MKFNPCFGKASALIGSDSVCAGSCGCVANQILGGKVEAAKYFFFALEAARRTVKFLVKKGQIKAQKKNGKMACICRKGSYMFFVCFFVRIYLFFCCETSTKVGRKMSLATRVVDNCLSKEDRIRGLYTGFNSDLLPFHSSFYVFKVSCTFFVRIYLFFLLRNVDESGAKISLATRVVDKCLSRSSRRLHSYHFYRL